MAEDKAMSVSVDGRRNRARSVVTTVLTVLLLVPVSILFLQIWDTTDADRTATRSERQGVEYLTKLGPVLTALVEAQGAALQGRPATPPALTAAVNGVAEVDGRLGKALGTTNRWDGLRTKIQALPTASAKGPLDGFLAHVEATELLLALYGAVRDNSQLARDPDNDVSHLQQAVTVDLPQTVGLSARTADLSLMVANAPKDQKELLAPQLAAVTLGIDVSVGSLTDNLQAAATDTGSATLSSNLLGSVDGIRQGVEGLVRAAGGNAPDVPALNAARTALQKATTGLSGTILTEMDGLLRSRLDDIDGTRFRAMITACAAVLIALLVIVVTPLLGRRRTAGGTPAGRDPDRAQSGAGGTAAAIFGENPYDPEPYGNEVPPTRRERSGALR
jgi:hypothetical protein